MVNIAEVSGKAEQLKGKVEQLLGKATRSRETQTRGIVDEARGTAMAKVADLKSKAKAALTGPVLISIAAAAVGASIAVALVRILARGRLTNVQGRDE